MAVFHGNNAFLYNIGDVLVLSSTMGGYITIKDREYDKHKNPYYVIQYINKGEYHYRRTTDYINKFGRLVKGKELQTIKVLYGLS